MKEGRRRIKREWQVTDVDGRDTEHRPVTKQGLIKALERLSEWTKEWFESDLYKSFDATDEDEREERDDLAPRIELYEQYQKFDGWDWEQWTSPEYYSPEEELLPTKKIQKIWDNR